MNWYRKIKAQTIIPVSDLPDREYGNKRRMNYFDIGHNAYLSGDFGSFSPDVKNSKLWQWDVTTGRFDVYEAKGRLTHSIKDYGLTYRGRYEEIGNNKRVSFAGPTSTIPDDLMAELVAEFGKDIKIYNFSS